MREGVGMRTTRKEAIEADILLWCPCCKVAIYLYFSKQQDMGLDSVQHQ